MAKKKKTIQDLIDMKLRGEKFLTAICYDYAWAKLVDETEIETIFCGDSMGMNIYGYSSTNPVTMDQMIYHCDAVRRGAPNTFMFGDMVYGSYETSPSDAVRNAIRLIKETGCDAVKLEGGKQFAPQVKAMTDAGIIVFGHLGITPQSAAMIGGFKAQGRDTESAKKIIDDCFALYEAGIKAILLECVPPELSGFVASKLPIPIFEHDEHGTLLYDMFGMFHNATPPRFAYRSKYNFSEMVIETLNKWIDETKDGSWPREENLYKVKGNVEDYIKAFEEFKDTSYM
jgi:3-methyl-2-oxobutanoate hydroxymethyltransferase